jgi:hypothetical protein
MTVQVPNQPQPQLRQRPENRVDMSIIGAGKYEVTPDQTFTINIAVKEFKGRWILTDKIAKGVEEHSITFRIWNYMEMVELRRKATAYDPAKRASTTDQDLLNRLKIQKLLQAWTFDKDNPRLKLHRVGNVLTDESWKAFTLLSPCIAERIINEMNMVLDHGG